MPEGVFSPSINPFLLEFFIIPLTTGTLRSGKRERDREGLVQGANARLHRRGGDACLWCSLRSGVRCRLHPAFRGQWWDAGQPSSADFCALNESWHRPRLHAVPAHVYIITALGAYLLGSIPTGFLVARSRGVDIRTVGSGNIGATNAFRVLGKGWGLAVLLIDFAKGLVACLVVPLLVRALLHTTVHSEGPITLALVAAVSAVLGHNFPIWLRFKGGKGIATTAGVLTALVPWALLVGFGVWVALFVLTRYVSLGSIGAAVTVPVATWFTTRGDPDQLALTSLTALLGIMAIAKHRSNIQRLVQGTESRIQFGRPAKGEHS